MMTQNITTISYENLTSTVLKLKHEDYRLVQMCATTMDKEYELTYTFALGYDITSIRMVISEDTEIMSISDIYAPAFLYENEMKDLFGIKISLINLDYKGEFYKIETKTPFKK
jgi:NADH:ubiquinone oxidoreductase 27 kD subunit